MRSVVDTEHQQYQIELLIRHLRQQTFTSFSGVYAVFAQCLPGNRLLELPGEQRVRCGMSFVQPLGLSVALAVRPEAHQSRLSLLIALVRLVSPMR